MTAKKKTQKINPNFRRITVDKDELWGFSSEEDMVEVLLKINEIIDWVNSQKEREKV